MGNLKNKETVTFASPQEMCQYVVSGERDLYNLETEDYIFKYNEGGSIAVYNLSREEAEELEKASEGKEYWGAYLGVGGSIYDDEDYEYRTCEETNMSYFKKNFEEGKWIDVTPARVEKKAWWKGFMYSAFHGLDEYGNPICKDVAIYHCSRCGRKTVIQENYCPSCGSKMKKEKR